MICLAPVQPHASWINGILLYSHFLRNRFTEEYCKINDSNIPVRYIHSPCGMAQVNAVFDGSAASGIMNQLSELG